MKLVRRISTRFVLLVVAGLVAVAVAAGLAFARSGAAPIGNGVVVIETALGYSGGEAAGTGIVLTSSGEVLTNNHVIRGATTIKVVVPKTGRTYTAHVVGYSVAADVAVLQLRGASNLKTVALGNSAALRVGQAVTALGNANGTGLLSSATGRITGLGKTITAGDDQGGSEQLTGLIETNAGVVAGDSGGPLLDGSGRVLGIDTAGSASDGFQDVSRSDAYAIPINRAVAIAKQIETGKASSTVHIGTTAFLGIEVEPAGSGATIVGVVSDGPAAAAGLAAGDTITALDGHAITTPTSLTTRLLTLKPGTRVTLTVVGSDGSTRSVSVTLGSGPAQ
jgi:S1-C subfamily serine protease